MKKSIIPRTETSKAGSSGEVLGCIDQYWSLLRQLILSVEADPDAVRLCESITVEWPSPLTRVAIKVKLNTVATAEHVKGALYLEAAMLLVNRAFFLADDARLILGPSCTGDLKRAAEKLRAAAGVLVFLIGRLENEWSAALAGIVKVDQRPIETLPSVCQGLRDMYLGQAQACAVALALSTGSSNPSVLCKLSLGVAAPH